MDTTYILYILGIGIFIYIYTHKSHKSWMITNALVRGLFQGYVIPTNFSWESKFWSPKSMWTTTTFRRPGPTSSEWWFRGGTSAAFLRHICCYRNNGPWQTPARNHSTKRRYVVKWGTFCCDIPFYIFPEVYLWKCFGLLRFVSPDLQLHVRSLALWTFVTILYSQVELY